MGIKPSKTVRCMSHTNTDTVKRQRGAAKGREEGGGAGQRKFCRPFLNRLVCLTTSSAGVWRREPSRSRSPAFRTCTLASQRYHILAFSPSRVWTTSHRCSSRLRPRDTNFILNFFFNTPTQREPIHDGRKHTDYFLSRPQPEELDW